VIVYLLVLAIQIACVVDVIRNGRNQLWIMALVFLPVASTVAYVIVEVLPRLQNNRHVRTARANVSAALDTEREIRAARAALNMTDTAANRLRMADALTALGRHEEALPYYREAIARGPSDMRTGEKLARAQFETGDAAGALETLEANPPQPHRATATDRGCCARASSKRSGARTRRFACSTISLRACRARKGDAATPRC